VSRVPRIVCQLACATLLHAPAALAQTSGPAPRVELGFGVQWDASQQLGSNLAVETTGTGSSLTLFNSSSELASAAGISGRVGVRVYRSLVAEAEASYLKPQLRVSVSGDYENANPVTATETVQQFTIGANLVWYVHNRHWPRLAPFALGGGGYLRQLHDPATLVQAGHFYQFGGGVSYSLVTTPHFHMKDIGVRADVRALVRAGGVAFDGGSATSPAAGVGAFVRF
jgi:hypothetical protein